MKKIARGAKNVIAFIYRAIRLRMVLVPLDRSCPFAGEMSQQGIFESKLTGASLDSLKTLVFDSSSDSYGVLLSGKYKQSLEEVFSKIAPVVKQYLGEESYIDGMEIQRKSPNQESISGNWHTDNVGNRIKCYICVSGDGTMPTLVVPSAKRIPTVYQWLCMTLIESLRWLGLTTDFDVKRVVECAHAEGTIYMFDTQLLHRGGYNLADSERVIFHMEFSNPQKHHLCHGPIGTNDHNQFRFDDELMSIPEFSCLLDNKRLVKGPEHFVYR